MHSFLSRANTIFAFTLSVVAGLTFCCFLTTAFDKHQVWFLKPNCHLVFMILDYQSSTHQFLFISVPLRSIYPQADVDIQTVRLFVKSVPDFTTDRSKNDLGFLSWDLKVRLMSN